MASPAPEQEVHIEQEVSEESQEVNSATKRQLKQPDQFVNLTQHGVAWAGENRRKALIAGGVAVLLILLAVGLFTLYQTRSAAAATAFGSAMQTYSTPLVNGGQPVPPGMKTFPDAKSRAAAANGQFLDVAHRYSMTQPGKLALYFAGLTYMEEGQNASAESTLKQVAGSYNGGLAALGKMALAEMYQQTGRDDEAAGLYNELSKGTALTVPATLAQLQLAEMYSGEGKTDAARKIYAELKDKDKNSKGKAGAAGEIAAEKLNPKAAPAPPAEAQ